MFHRPNTINNNSVDASPLSSNRKVMQYLQTSPHHSTNGSSTGLHKTTSHSPDTFPVKNSPIRDVNLPQQRFRSSSDNTSTSSVTNTFSRSDFPLDSRFSDPGGYRSTFSSNASSSGVFSAASDLGHEEMNSNSSEELDFNLGFDQISENDSVEVANLREVDEDNGNSNDSNDHNEDDDNEDVTDTDATKKLKSVDGDEQSLKKCNTDATTIQEDGESNLDARISQLEEFLRKSYSSSNIYDEDGVDDDDYEFNNDHTITANQSNPHQRASFLHDSTFTLCPQDRFSAYTDGDDQPNEQLTNNICVRSNSLGINPLNTKSVLLETAPKKVVRFADMLGLDLESIRYMTPPDTSTTSLIQECIRIKLEQLRLAKNKPTSSLIDSRINSHPNRSSTSSPIPSKRLQQYYLISKYFTSPSIIPAIYERQVMLERLYTNDSVAFGTVRVHNIAYDKHVFARVTENEWESFHDVHAWHSMNYPEDNTDTFTFEIRLGKYNDPAQVPKEIYFSVCLKIVGKEYWDNNSGWNYILNVMERR